MPESFGALTRELLFACRALCCDLVPRLHPLGRLVGGELAQLDDLGAGGGGTVAPLLRVPSRTVLPALGRDELRGGIVAEHSAGETSGFERVPLARGAQLDLRGGRGFACVAHLGVLAGGLLADAGGPALDLARAPRGAAPALLYAVARLFPFGLCCKNREA